MTTRVNNTPKPHPYLPTPLPNTLGKHNAIPAKIRCLDKKYASGVDAAEVASYTAQTRNEVTEERYVTMVNGRVETPQAWSVKEMERDELELMEKRKFLQQRGFCLLQYDGSVSNNAIAKIMNPAKARDDGLTDRPGEIPGAKTKFFRELERTVKKLTGAKYCCMTAWSIRNGAKRVKGSEESKGVSFVGAYSFFSHSDFTPAMGRAAYKMCMKRVPELSESKAKRMKYSFMNIWKPTNDTVQQFPLGILDWRTVDPQDCHEVELGYALTPTSKKEKGTSEGEAGYHNKDDGYGARNKADKSIAGFYMPRLAQVVHRPNHKWVYFPNQTLNEIWLFTQYDQRFDENNKERFCKHTFHSAFWDESAPENPIRRQSIEIRLLCAYEDDGDSNKSKL